MNVDRLLKYHHNNIIVYVFALKWLDIPGLAQATFYPDKLAKQTYVPRGADSFYLFNSFYLGLCIGTYLIHLGRCYEPLINCYLSLRDTIYCRQNKVLNKSSRYRNSVSLRLNITLYYPPGTKTNKKKILLKLLRPR